MKDDRCEYRIIHRSKVDEARKKALPDEEIEEMGRLFKAMADPTRLRMLLALQGGEMCVCDLAACLQISESATSHQLRLLRQLKLVSNRRQGPVLYYRLTDHHIDQLISLALEHARE